MYTKVQGHRPLRFGDASAPNAYAALRAREEGTEAEEYMENRARARWDLAEAIYMQASACASGYTVRHT